MSRLLLELHRAKIFESGVQAFAIVPNLNVFKDGCSCQCMSCELTGDTFSLKSAEETFSNCVVITISNPTHAHLDVRIDQAALVSRAGVLAALIGMVQQIICGLAC